MTIYKIRYFHFLWKNDDLSCTCVNLVHHYKLNRSSHNLERNFFGEKKMMIFFILVKSKHSYLVRSSVVCFVRLQWRIQDFPYRGRAPIRGGVDLRHGHFLVKMYVKTKELGPMGACAEHAPLDPPMVCTGWWNYFTELLCQVGK